METKELSGVLEVRGEAVIEASPDRAFIHAIVSEAIHSGGKKLHDSPRAGDVDKARSRIDEKIKDIVRRMTEHDLSQDDLLVKAFSMTRASDETSGFMEKNKQTYYTLISKTLMVKVDDIDKVPALISMLAKEEVSSLKGVDYKVRNESELSIKAVAKAAEVAKKKAEEVAESIGTKVLGLVSMHEAWHPRRNV